MKNTKILVTVWSCKEWDQTLVLEGTPEQTRKTAAGYRATGSRAKLSHGTQMMTRRQIKAFPELSC